MAEFHHLSAEQTCQHLRSDACHGLTEAEAASRLHDHGPNRLPEPPPRSLWRMLLTQFQSLLTLVLLAAGLLAGFIGDTLDMVVILAVVTFNGLLGFYQEYRAEKILDLLKGMLAPQARVRRQGNKQEISADQLVPGDLVLIEAGDRVPADGRLVQSHGLEIDESSLTGESQAVAKDHHAIHGVETPLAERSNQLFMNSIVTRGRGEMLITATGGNSEMGRLAHMLAEPDERRTPLQIRLDGLGQRLALLALAVVAVLLALGALRGQPWAENILNAVALAVAAIPEGLPAVVTVTLAIGMYRMAHHGAVVKRLAAVETLGCTTMICSDKTGTLTMNQMTARRLWMLGHSFAVSGEGYGCHGEITPLGESGDSPPDIAHLRPWLRATRLCNDARITDDGGLVGDPTEGALLCLSHKAGLGDQGNVPRLAEIPFDSTRKIMLTLHQTPEGLLLLAKGAFDQLLPRCTQIATQEGACPLDGLWRDQIHTQNEHFASQALRVLAFAEKHISPQQAHDLLQAAQDMVFCGLVGIQDPPRPTARASIAACHQAGIGVKMITGDHRMTAAAIGRQLGLEGDVVNGADLDRMDDDQLSQRIEDIAVFARVSPQHKVRIVAALQARGHVVAMTGDGVNDAAALRQAHMGIAMGQSGSDVTREAASMVLAGDDFSLIEQAVREGRTITDNILKFVRFQLATNFGALLCMLAAPLLGLPVPFHAIQILWVNIIMDGPPAMALAFDPSRPEIMQQPPRPATAPILSGPLLGRLVSHGLVMMVGTLGILWWDLEQGNDHAHARTLAFTTFVLFQFGNIFNARVSRQSAFGGHMLRNPPLLWALAAVLTLQIAAIHWPWAQNLFHTVPLSLADWAIALGVASILPLLEELRKHLNPKHHH